MAALTSQTYTTPTTGGGFVPSATAVSASDTIAASQVGSIGVIVRIINAGGSPDVATITDPGKTASGSSPTNPTVTVTNATTKEFFIPAAFLDPTAQTITIAHSFTTSVTIEVKRL